MTIQARLTPVRNRKEEALRRLAEVASPYRLGVVKTQYSELPGSCSSGRVPTGVRRL